MLKKVIIGFAVFVCLCLLMEYFIRSQDDSPKFISEIVQNVYKNEALSDSLGELNNMRSEYDEPISSGKVPFSLTIVGNQRVLIMSGVAIQHYENKQWEIFSLKRDELGITAGGPLDKAEVR